jgi:hypothetical protein
MFEIDPVTHPQVVSPRPRGLLTLSSLLTPLCSMLLLACQDDTSVATTVTTETGETIGDGDGDTTGDGDGDTTGDGDGDGDGEPGDGDGDGDGDGEPGDGDGDVPALIDCQNPLDPPSEGVCTAEGQAGGTLLIQGDVLTPETVFVNGGGVLIENGIITCVGCDCTVDPVLIDATITCADAVISPGLINTHDHITYAHNWPIGVGPDRYEHRHDWREGLNGHAPLPYSGGAPAEAVLAAELRFVMGGATSIAGAGGRWGLLRNVDSADNEGIPLQAADSDTFPLDDAGGLQLDGSCNYGNNATDEAHVAGLMAYLPHIGEGIDRYANNEMICTSISPDIVADNTAIVHAVGTTPAEAQVISDAKAQVIWSPRSNVVLYGSTAPVTLMDTLGVNLALGTDWLPSGSMNLLRELACAEYLDDVHFGDRFDDKRMWEMVTTNAAFAIGAEVGLGMIKPGYVADIAVFAKSGEDAHGAVVRGHETKVALVLRGGVPLYGDAALLATDAVGGAMCEALDVCGVAKRACVAEDTASTLAELLMVAEYPLGFCPDEVPMDEPSCVPWRPMEFPDGPVEGVDDDGDGIPNDEDLCPGVFSPVFGTGAVPLYEPDTQPDEDMDGVGDACDPCPFDDADACTNAGANDFDADGVPNGVDNCPNLANDDQADADSDGHGDLCDDCADPNPGFGACATAVVAIADESHPDHPDEDSVVFVAGVYVTAVRPMSMGFWVETGTQEPFTGLAVFSNGNQPALAVGDVVNVTGTYEEYFGLVEITSPTVTIVETGSPLPFAPLLVDPATVATNGMLAEDYEAMLLRVEDVAITVQNSDAPMDFDEFTVTGGLRINDSNFQALNNTCMVGTQFTSIVGVLDFSFSNTKLEPRSANDIESVGCNPAP